MVLTFLERYRDWGLLIIRVGVGLCIALIPGWMKLKGGPDMWVQVGSTMGNFGITFAPTVWGFMAMVAEFFGGLLIVIGFLTRPAAAMLAFTMFVAASHHKLSGDPWAVAANAIELFAVFTGLIFLGPGRYSIDRK